MMINLKTIKTKFNAKTIILVLIVAVILVIGAFLVLRQSTKQQGKIAYPKRPASFLTQEQIRKLTGKGPLSAKALSIKKQVIKNKIGENRGDLLLVKSDGYKIEYIKTPDVFFVTVLKQPTDTYHKQAEDWFGSKGFTQNDLCNLGLHFTPDYSLESKTKIVNFQSRPTGCQ